MKTVRLSLVLIALGIAVNSTASLGLFLWSQSIASRTNRDATNTRYALCTLRRDLEVRATTSREFLREHPNGIPGISAKTIRDGLANQERTIKALSGLDCG